MMSHNLRFLLTLTKTQTILSRKFDRGMGNGIGFNEFLILLYLSQAERKAMRRVDLADKLGITASGITRLLLPMEKIGLVKSGANTEDARVKMIAITKSGEEKMQEARERLELFLEEILVGASSKEIESITNLLFRIGGKVLMN